MKHSKIVEAYLSQSPDIFGKEGKAKKKRIKVMRPSQIINKQRTIYKFEGRFLESFGEPEKHSKWFITGPSYSGKSTFLFILSNYFSQFGLVDYNNHEEAGGDSKTVAIKLEQIGMKENDRIRYFKAPIESDTNETFTERLLRRRSAEFAFIDSLQHAEMNKRKYLDITNLFCNPKKAKSLVLISHWVKDDLTKFIKHDCDIKIEVIGFVAYVLSRYGGNKPFVIWEEGAKQYWGKKYKQVIEGKYWPGQKK